MKIKKVLALLLTSILTFSMTTGVFASTEDEIAEAQVMRQEAEAGLAQAQANISSLESKKQELDNYMAQLEAQYNELTENVAQLDIQAGQKQEELKEIQKNLDKAGQAADKQYESMKIRIAYMYENSRSSMLGQLLSSGNLSDFISQVQNISEMITYDRNMLKKYESIQEEIQEQETVAKQEVAEIDSLMKEKAQKKQEVQNMVAETGSSIASYVEQISANEAEASALMSQIDSADNSIYVLTQQLEQENAAQQAEEIRQSSEEQYDAEENSSESTDTEETASEGSYTEESNSEEYDMEESYTESDSEEELVPDNSYEDTYEDTEQVDHSSSSESSSSSGQGTYLGNFVLTAYCNCAQCCGTAGNATASGVMPTSGHTVAMAGVPFGTQLLINGTVYTVEDLGTPYGHVDIYFDSHAEALSFGLQYADVYQL